MKYEEIAERYRGIPVNSLVILPENKTSHAVYFCNRCEEDYCDKFYAKTELKTAFLRDGDTVYLPWGYVIHPRTPGGSCYVPLWEQYDVVCLLPDGSPVPVAPAVEAPDKIEMSTDQYGNVLDGGEMI